MFMKTKEFYEIMGQFEKDAKDLFYGHKIERVDRNENALTDQFYHDGYVNTVFRAYIFGYMFHKSIGGDE